MLYNTLRSLQTHYLLSYRFGSIGSSCDDTGKCTCKDNFAGLKCGPDCAEGFFKYPRCEPCNCDPKGVTEDFEEKGGCASVLDPELLCTCKENVMGRTCQICKPLFWNLQEHNPLGCEDCECNQAGTIGALGKEIIWLALGPPTVPAI